MAAAQVTIPLSFLTDVVPYLHNADELHVSLALFRLAALAGSDEAPIAERAVLADAPLRKTLGVTGAASSIDQRIFDGLELAVGRNTLLRFVAVDGDTETAWYYINTSVARALVDAMVRNAVKPPKVVWDGEQASHIAADPPNAFRAYEQNIGPLTPIMADRISAAAMDYPAGWIEEAIAEAVYNNKRSWAYVSRILENWHQNGRSNDRQTRR